jgi:hypothetical protein
VEEELFACGKNEVVAAIHALQASVLEFHFRSPPPRDGLASSLAGGCGSMMDRSLLRHRRRDSPRKNSAGCLYSLLGSALHGWSIKPVVVTTKIGMTRQNPVAIKPVGGTLVSLFVVFLGQDRWLAAAPLEVIS